MANITPRIRELFETKLANTMGVPDIAWENVKYEPQTGVPYVKPTLVPTIRRPSCVGRDQQQYYQGIFIVQCFVPVNKGPSASDSLAQLITEEFEASNTITNGTTSIQIREASQAQGITEGAWHKTIVSISWYTYA